MVQPSSSTNKQIRSLLLLLGSAILFAILTGVFFVVYYSPSGVYLAKNVILAPEVLTQMNFNDSNSKTGGISRFIFDHIEFKWQNQKTHQGKSLYVDEEKYAKIYQLLAKDKSIPEDSSLQELFMKAQPAQLLVVIRTENNSAAQAVSKTFQVMQFIPDQDYYRVELHEQNASVRWAYYRHPQIFQTIFSILVPQI